MCNRVYSYLYKLCTLNYTSTTINILAHLLTFMECTAISIRLSIKASSISLVNRPLPPTSARGYCNILSPDVFITTISIAPSSYNS